MLEVIRGHDERDMVKNMRDQLRRHIADGKTHDNLRHNVLLHSRVKDINRLKAVKPVVSLRGGDLRNIVQEGRKKAQFKKASSIFMTHTQPVVNKVSHSFN
jgi:hypothetical protein